MERESKFANISAELRQKLKIFYGIKLSGGLSIHEKIRVLKSHATVPLMEKVQKQTITV